MHLYLLRHGHAEVSSLTGRDEDRTLTSKGRDGISRLAAELKKRGVAFDVILVSPYVRARQTAEILRQEIPTLPEPILTDALSCGASLGDLAEALLGYEAAKSVLIVGHMPDVGEISAQLLGESREVAFRPGTLLALRIDPPLRLAAAKTDFSIS